MGVRLILGFAISFSVLIIAPTLLSQQVSADPALRAGDVVDLLTPFVLVSFYYWLFRSADYWSVEPASGLTTALFVFGSLLFVEGHGMHFAANSIGHLLVDAANSSAYSVTYFYDEVLSHYMWHLGTLILALVLLWRHYQPLRGGLDGWKLRSRQRAALVTASALYGITVFLAGVEGQTVALDLPTSAAIAAIFLFQWRKQGRLPGGPVFSFLGMGYTITAVSLLGWGAYWGRFPQFSDLGLIK